MTLNRRTMLATALFAAILPGAASAATTQLKSVRIDTSGLASRGVSGFARRIDAVAAALVPQVFAGRLNPGARDGAVLVIRIDQVEFGASGGGGSRSEFIDSLSGRWELLGPNGARIAGDSLFAQNTTSAAGSYYVPGSETLRLQQLVSNYLTWAVRALP